MADNSAAGIPNSTTTTTAITSQVVPVPTVKEFGIPEITMLGGLFLLIAAVQAIFVKQVTAKITDFKDAHKPVHDNIESKLSDLSHKIANERQRVGILETHRGNDVERIVKLETNLHNIEKSQDRIEAALEKMSGDLGNRIDHWSEQLSQSIREVRDVKPRG